MLENYWTMTSTLSISKTVGRLYEKSRHRGFKLHGDSKSIKILSSSHSETSPSPHLGIEPTCTRGRVNLFSGRGGVSMTAIEKKDSPWMLKPSKSMVFSTPSWMLVAPTVPTREAEATMRLRATAQIPCVFLAAVHPKDAFLTFGRSTSLDEPGPSCARRLTLAAADHPLHFPATGCIERTAWTARRSKGDAGNV